MILPDHRVPPLQGPDAISKHYAQVHSVADETVVPVCVLCEGVNVFLEMEVYFRYVCSPHPFPHPYTCRFVEGLLLWVGKLVGALLVSVLLLMISSRLLMPLGTDGIAL